MRAYFRSRNRRTRGYTLIEVTVVMAILSILASMLAPAFSGYIQKSSNTACVVVASSVRRAYATGYAEAYARKRVASFINFQEALADGIADFYGIEPVSTGVYQGLCPTGGVYTCAFSKNGQLGIVCSVHGQVTDALPSDYIRELLTMKAEDTEDGYCIDKYFSNKGIGSTLDSTATHAAAQAPKVAANLGKLIGADLSDCSWRIIMRTKYQGDSTKYEVLWSNTNIADLEVGDRFAVTRYYNGVFTEGTCVVTSKVQDGVRYNIFNESSFVADD